MVGLDVTHQVIVSVALIQKIADQHRHAATDTLLHAVKFYADFYSGIYPHVAKVHGCFGHDVLAFIYLTNPELFTVQSGRIRVATEGIAQGQTMMNRRESVAYPQAGWGDAPDTYVCMQVQSEAVIEVFTSTLLRPWLVA